MNRTESGQNVLTLEVENLSISYETRKGDVEAVRDVFFEVKEGETIGLVGESGCGKSTIAFGIVNFLGPNGKIVDGSVRFQGNELVGRSQEELKKLRGDRIAMVFQDPMQALNPSVRLGEQLAEAGRVRRGHARDHGALELGAHVALQSRRRRGEEPGDAAGLEACGGRGQDCGRSCGNQ